MNYNWNQFKNLPGIKDLPDNEQIRKYNIFKESAQSPLSSSSAAGAAGGRSQRLGNETVIVLVSPSENFTIQNADTWYYFLLSSIGNTSLFNTGIPYTWSIDSQYIVQNKGYVIYFYDGDSNYKALFINTIGRIVSSFETSSYSSYSIDGHSIIAVDGDGSPLGGLRLHFFDGDKVKTYDFDGSTGWNIGSDDWDYGMIDGTAIVEINYDTYTSYRLMNYNECVEIYNDDSDGLYNIRVDVQSYSNFGSIVVYNNDSNYYESIKIFDNKGTLLQDIDLTTGLNYTDMYNGNPIFYGINQASFILWTDNDSDDYLIFNFNGDTKSLFTQNITRGYNYRNFDLDWDTAYPNNSYDYTPGSLVMYLYGSYNYGIYDIYSDYIKVAYIFQGQTQFSEEIISERGIYSIYNISGTSTGSATFSGLTSSSWETSGDGSGAEFEVIVSGGSYSVNITKPGRDFTGEENIIIYGDSLGGSTPANDLTFQVETVVYADIAFYSDCSDKSIVVLHTKNYSQDGQLAGLFLTPENSPVYTNFGSKEEIFLFEGEFPAFGYENINDNIMIVRIYNPDTDIYNTYYDIYNRNGVLLDSLEIAGFNTQNYRIQAGTLFIRNWDGPPLNWYWNESGEGFVKLTDVFYSQRNYVDNYEFENTKNKGSMVLFNPVYYSGPSFRILTPTSITEDITLTPSDTWGYSLSPNYLMYYYRNDDGFIVIELYNYDGTLVKSQVTIFTDVDDDRNSGSRIYFRLYNMVNSAYVIMTPKGILGKFTLGEDSNDYSLNDYRYWD